MPINFRENLSVKYCEVNKENNLHIANNTSNPHKLPKKKEVQISKNNSYYVSNAIEIW
jgi:hypothetical protein